MCTMATSDNEDCYTSYTSGSEDIGSEDTPEELSEQDISSPSTTSSPVSSTTASPASSRTTSPATTPRATTPTTSPRRSPRLDLKRSRILEKDGVNFRAKRRRVDPVPAASLPPRRAGDSSPSAISTRSGDSCSGRYSPSLPSSRSSSASPPPRVTTPPSASPPRATPPPSASPPPHAFSPPSASPPLRATPSPPASPTPYEGRTTRSGRYYPYRRPASSAVPRPLPTTTAVAPPPTTTAAAPSPPPTTAARPPPPTTVRPPQTPGPVTRSKTGSLPLRTSPSTKRRLEEDTYQSRASKRLQKAWELSDAEKENLCRWRTSAHERFEALESLAPTDPRKKRGKKEEASNKANLCLKKLLDTTDLLIPTTTFARLGRGVLAEVAPERKYHFAGAALKVLQRATEDIAISSLAVIYDFTKHRNGVELKEKDFKIFRQIYKGSYPYF